MQQIIKFADVDVDGCGTNVEVYIQVEGKHELTNGIIEKLNEIVENYKMEHFGEWDTDSVVDASCDYLKSEGYHINPLIPDYEIIF